MSRQDWKLIVCMHGNAFVHDVEEGVMHTEEHEVKKQGNEEDFVHAPQEMYVMTVTKPETVGHVIIMPSAAEEMFKATGVEHFLAKLNKKNGPSSIKLTLARRFPDLELLAPSPIYSSMGYPLPWACGCENQRGACESRRLPCTTCPLRRAPALCA